MSNYTRRNSGFDHKAFIWVRDHVRGVSRDERLLLFYLATRCDPDHQCFPMQSLIAKDLECSRSHINTLLTKLEDKGLISRKRRPNSSTRYTLLISGCPPVTTPGCLHSGDTRLSKQNDIKKPYEVANEVTKKIEVTEEYIGETSNDVTHEENGKEKKQKQPEGKEHSALKIVAKYYKADPSRTVMVGFWFALMRRYYADKPRMLYNLTKPQYRHLYGLFTAFGNDAFYIIAAAVCDWDTASVHAAQIEGLKASKNEYPKYGAIPKSGPTTTFISNAASGVADYWHMYWKKTEALKPVCSDCNQEAA